MSVQGPEGLVLNSIRSIVAGDDAKAVVWTVIWVSVFEVTVNWVTVGT